MGDRFSKVYNCATWYVIAKNWGTNEGVPFGRVLQIVRPGCGGNLEVQTIPVRLIFDIDNPEEFLRYQVAGGVGRVAQGSDEALAKLAEISQKHNYQPSLETSIPEIILLDMKACVVEYPELFTKVIRLE